MSAPIPEHVIQNREAWTQKAAEYRQSAERCWSLAEPEWGIWGLPERELRLLPAELSGRDVLEAGCGTAYVSAWMARRGARPVGIDPTPAQLATAREMQEKFDLRFPLVEGYAEALPFPDASFDHVISEYGACLWADPYRWIPEVARVLRPGGTLTFLTNAVLQVLCAPDTEADGPMDGRLMRPLFGLYRVQWGDSPGEIEFQLSHGEWIRLLRENGLSVERLLELRAPEGASTRHFWADAEWSRRWPSEEVWVAVKRG